MWMRNWKSAALAATFAIPSAFLIANPGSAAPDECLASPNHTSPQGQHWYYRLERSSGRKCWYLHAQNLPVHRAAAEDAEPAKPAAKPAAPAPKIRVERSAPPEAEDAPVAAKPHQNRVSVASPWPESPPAVAEQPRSIWPDPPQVKMPLRQEASAVPQAIAEAPVDAKPTAAPAPVVRSTDAKPPAPKSWASSLDANVLILAVAAFFAWFVYIAVMRGGRIAENLWRSVWRERTAPPKVRWPVRPDDAIAGANLDRATMARISPMQRPQVVTLPRRTTGRR